MLDAQPVTLVARVLAAFGDALTRGDIAAARTMFVDDCYWRDLVSFTWNIATCEGQDQIGAMLVAQLAQTAPSNWHLAEGEAVADEGGITTAWIGFDTATGRGYGMIRLRGDKIWTLLTTLVELKGYEEPKGFARAMGAKHGAGKNRSTWKEDRDAEDRSLGYDIQPYVLIVGGGQGASHWGRGCANWACRRSS